MIHSEALSQPRSRMRRCEGNLPSPSIFWTMQNETILSDGDLDKQSGRRYTSPEREFCDGWCRDDVQMNGSLPQADVVRRVSEYSTIPGFC